MITMSISITKRRLKNKKRKNTGNQTDDGGKNIKERSEGVMRGKKGQENDTSNKNLEKRE